MAQGDKNLDWRSAIAKVRQERGDVSKALAATQANLASDLTKEGAYRGGGGTAGKWLGPIIGDFIVGGLLNMVAPGLGSMYQKAKQVPILKATGAAIYSGAGSKVGAEIGGSMVDVRDARPQVEGYLEGGDGYGEGTVSGKQAMRFDRGASEALDLQKDEQLKVLDDLVNQQAIGDAGGAFLKSITGDVLEGMGEKYEDSLDAISANRELTGADYLDALTKASGEKGSMLGDIFDFSPMEGSLSNLGKANKIGGMSMKNIGQDKLLKDLGNVLGQTRETLFKSPRYGTDENNYLMQALGLGG